MTERGREKERKNQVKSLFTKLVLYVVWNVVMMIGQEFIVQAGRHSKYERDCCLLTDNIYYYYYIYFHTNWLLWWFGKDHIITLRHTRMQTDNRHSKPVPAALIRFLSSTVYKAVLPSIITRWNERKHKWNSLSSPKLKNGCQIRIAIATTTILLAFYCA